MRQALTSVMAGLGLAAAAAIIIVAVTGPNVVEFDPGRSTAETFFMTVFAVSAYAAPPALFAIGLAEARRVQGLPYWLAIGGATSLLAILWLLVSTADEPGSRPSLINCTALLVAGLAAAWIYWYRAGRRSGRIAIALAKAAEIPLGPELSARRCRMCTLVVLMIGLIPLSLAGWVAVYGRFPELKSRILSQGEKDARARLDHVGLPDLTVTFDGNRATLGGNAPVGMTAEAAFAQAKAALAPMIGLPGVAARLDNAISTNRDASLNP